MDGESPAGEHIGMGSDKVVSVLLLQAFHIKPELANRLQNIQHSWLRVALPVLRIIAKISGRNKDNVAHTKNKQTNKPNELYAEYELFFQPRPHSGNLIFRSWVRDKLPSQTGPPARPPNDRVRRRQDESGVADIGEFKNGCPGK